MKPIIKLKKGLNLRLIGEAPLTLKQAALSATYALQPTDFLGIVPRLQVKENDHVKIGDTLFADKETERIKFVAPVSGTVTSIVRGERRKLLRIIITPDAEQQEKALAPLDLAKDTPEAVTEKLLEAGLFAFIQQRPYAVTASPKDTPKAIFVSAFSKMPLAADFSFVVKDQEEAFKSGLAVLSRLAKVHLGISPDQVGQSFVPTDGVDVNVFDGPNPSGNVGVQINHISPINKGDVVWTIGAEEVIFIGRYALTGKLDFSRRIAVAGAEVQDPSYYEIKLGASLESLLKGQLKTEEHIRVIDGNPLVGRKADLEGYVGAHTTEVCALPEGDNVHEVFGWIAPRFNEFSTSRSYFSWLFGKKKYNPDCRIKGGQRHMIMSAEYERVFPMDVLPSFLIKAIITGDIDRQEALGIYEVAPEDFAVAEYIDSSKLELQRIVREGLDILRKENS